MTAAAISVSSSLSDLSRAGVESARVAFRIAVHVERVSRLIEPRAEDEQPASWAYVVTGLTEEEVQKEVDEFNATSVSSMRTLPLNPKQLLTKLPPVEFRAQQSLPERRGQGVHQRNRPTLSTEGDLPQLPAPPLLKAPTSARLLRALPRRPCLHN